MQAKRLRIFVIVLMVAIAAVIALTWLGPTAGVHVEMRGHTAGVDPRIAATVQTLLLEIALFELAQMLTLLGSGEFFSVGVIRHFRRFALWLLLLALIGLFAPMLQLPNNQHMATAIAIDFREIVSVGITLLLFLLARLLERAGEIEQENREIV